MNRNRLLFIKRNTQGLAFLTSSFIFLAAALPKKALNFALHKEWNHLQALLRGLRWNFQYLTSPNSTSSGGAQPNKPKKPVSEKILS